MSRFLLLTMPLVLLGQATGTGVGVSFRAPKAAGVAAAPARYTDCYTATPEADMVFSMLDFASCPPGTDNIDTAPNFNGTDMTLLAEYFGGDAGASSWASGDAGPTLSLAGTGSAPTTGRDNPWSGDSDGAVKLAGNSQKYYEAPDTTSVDITTQDFVSTIIFRAKETGGANVLVSKRADATTTGWHWAYTSGDDISFEMKDTGAGETSVGGGPFDEDEWAIATVVVDRSEGAGGMKMFINGQVDGSVGDPSAVTMTNSETFTIGDYSGGSALGADKDLAYFGMWVCDACLGGAGTFDDDVQEIHARILGLWPVYSAAATTVNTWEWAQGKSCWNDTQTKLHKVSPDFFCTDATNGMFGSEGQTQFLLWSEDLTQTWTLSDADDSISADSDVAADGETTMDSLVTSATGGDSTHCVQQNVSTNPDRTFSVFITPKARDWAYFEDGNFTAYVNASTCTLGTVTGAGNGDPTNVRAAAGGSCQLMVNVVGTGGTKTVKLCGAEADTDNSYTGAGVADVAFWGAQFWNTNTDHMHSGYKKSVGASGSGGESKFALTSTAMNTTRGVKFKSMYLPGGLNNDSYMMMGLFEAAASTTEYHFIRIFSLKWELNTATAGGALEIDAEGTSNYTFHQDATFHDYCVDFEVDETATVYFDDALEGTDAEVLALPTVDSVAPMNSNFLSNGGSGYIRDVKIYSDRICP